MTEEYIAWQMKTKFVYHYTSFDALFAILEGYRKNKNDKYFFSFRASNIYNLNDPTEMEYGYYFVKRLLPIFEHHFNVPKDLRLSAIYDSLEDENKCIEDFKYERPIHATQTAIIPYVASFSKRGDYLPMWSLYGNNGKGVCLSFNKHIFLEFIKEMQMGDVVYDSRANLYEIKGIISLLYNSYLNAYDNEKTKPRITDKIHELATICLAVSPFVKNRDYEYEKEFRLSVDKFYRPDSPIIANYNKWFKIDPYVEFRIPIHALEKIIIGPDANYEVMSHVLSNELKECGLSPKLIRKSKISFTSNKR